MSNYFTPICIEKYNIYDVYYNDDNQIIIISPMENDCLNIYLCEETNRHIFCVEICSHNHTFIYHLTTHQYNDVITLSINGELITTKINTYGTFTGDIIMSTIVKSEDKYIKQWIKYYTTIGVTRFIIYDNSEDNTLEYVLENHITNKLVILIKWNYPYRLPKSGISGQTTQQNHSVYAFNTSKYILLFDVDEYLNPQTKTFNINECLNDIMDKHNININEIGSFKIHNRFFYNPNNLETHNYEFLKIYDCDKITQTGHEKHIVIPKNIKVFSVHEITVGKNPFVVNDKYMYFNHYYFLNKNDRGKNTARRTDDSIKRIIANIDLSNA